MDMIKIGEQIRRERKKHNLTIAELSERVNISSNFMGNIERGVDTPSVETLINIANALFVGVDTLVKDSLDFEPKDGRQLDFESMDIMKKIKSMSKTQRQCVLSCIKALNEFNK